MQKNATKIRLQNSKPSKFNNNAVCIGQAHEKGCDYQ
jgi:hypothetical protein